ncbi:hypothetical protein KQI41_03925 [Tissierella pigra]|uniref:hypothetical protein n=1 Tax=Tissierella pigra TaxID=2607614 RepID=UPI001C10AF03|nr:hypothetical protein [Tissierella pigra]MBU5425552.1 hypothetical protein [Tissierella pigra]
MKRDKLVEIAKLEAQKCFHGNVMGLESNIEPIINLFSKWTSLENYDSYIVVAEGNINNVSGTVKRNKNKNIRGYIRIPDDYNFIK